MGSTQHVSIKLEVEIGFYRPILAEERRFRLAAAKAKAQIAIPAAEVPCVFAAEEEAPGTSQPQPGSG